MSLVSEGTLLKPLWDRSRSPTKHVSDKLGIPHWKLRAAIHTIKARSGLGPADRIIIFDDDKVTDATGCEIGNIYDEV